MHSSGNRGRPAYSGHWGTIRVNYLKWLATGLLLSAIAVAPAHAQRLFSSSTIAQSPADEAAYKKAFEETLSKPGDPDILLKYAALAVKTGNIEGAISALERLLLIEGDQPRVKLELGVLYFRLNSYEAARAYLEDARNSASANAETKQRAGEYLAEVDSKTQKSRFYGDLLFAWQYSTNAIGGPVGSIQSFGTSTVPSPTVSAKPDFNFAMSTQLHHRYDLGRQDSGQMETDFAFYGTRQVQVSEANLLLFDLFTGPRMKPFDGWLKAMTVKPFLTGRYVSVHDQPTYWAWGSGMEVGAPIGPHIETALTLLGRRREFINNIDVSNNSNSSGNEITTEGEIHFKLTSAMTLSFSPAYTRFIAQVPSECFSQFGTGASFAARFTDPSGISDRQWTAALTAGYAHADYDLPDLTVNPNVTRQQNDYSIALSVAIPLHDRFTVVTQTAYNRRDASLSNFAYDAFTALVGIGWRF